MSHILEVDSVIIEFGSKRVLQDVYLKSETGKVSGLLGRNGAGKTCLLKIIFGELSSSFKSVRLNGDPISITYGSPKNIRYLPQCRFIPGFLTIKKIFNDHELDFSDFTNEFPEFEKFYSEKFKYLSGGERRIVEIYSILASEAKFCLLDEPFTLLMPIHVEKIKNLIVREKENKGILITDHMYLHIIDICDNLYVLTDGKTYLTQNTKDIEALGYAKLNIQ